jgi:hypothetical protein
MRQHFGRIHMKQCVSVPARGAAGAVPQGAPAAASLGVLYTLRIRLD